MINNVKKSKNQDKNIKKKQETEKFKQQYFDRYDDVKSHTNKIVDW